MALDAALFESVASGSSLPVLRIYRWSPPTVTIGYGQRLDGAVDLDLARRLGLDVVRRPTGGRAVLHDVEVTYAVIAPDGGAFPGDILGNYRVIAEVLREALRGLGVEAELVSRRAPPDRSDAGRSSVCFTAPSSYELVVQGRKIAGSAQKRSHGAFLQHGSIPVEMDLERLFAVLEPDPSSSAEVGARRLSRSVGWLNRYAPRALTVSEVEAKLLRSFELHLGVHFVVDSPTASELEKAREFAVQNFSSL